MILVKHAGRPYYILNLLFPVKRLIINFKNFDNYNVFFMWSNYSLYSEIARTSIIQGVFLYMKVIKYFTSKISSAANRVKTYPPDISICIVALIKLYLDKTAALRHDVNLIFFN